ncbi:MAG: histone deacetylase [Candidatus Eremiobacteraeota bacterium]|nr:histone deacetylase [Candidatus Eremiobacteraeota bacterium]
MKDKQNRIVILYDDIFLKHDMGVHPECADRLRHLIPAIRSSPVNEYIDWLKPVPAYEDEIALIHSREMIDYIRQTTGEGGGWLDPETYVSPESLPAALTAGGAGKVALGLVFELDYRFVFIPCRPPGHHATSSRSMGFCLFNNVALCARIALEYEFAKKIAIIDWDVHHGNGTEEIFYTSDQVLFMSVHQHPFFPGTGFVEDIGMDKGRGFTINRPLPAGAGNEEYIRIFKEKFAPALEEFRPDLFIISAGFDSHKHDPTANHYLDAQGFRSLAAIVKEMAEKSPADGRIIAFLEGGYHASMLSESVIEMLKVFVDM